MYVMQNNVLSILLWNRELGCFYWDKKQTWAVFDYNPIFISAGIDFAQLGASICIVLIAKKKRYPLMLSYNIYSPIIN
jgi:hypothetical protein